MYLGAQIMYSPGNLRFVAQCGVTHVDATPATGLGLEDVGHWLREPLLRLRDEVEAFGLTLAALHLPLTSAGIEHQIWPHIMLGTPERDHEIEQVIACVRAASEAGITTLLYNLAILPVVRSPQRTVGRGGVTYSRFRYAEVAGDAPHPQAPVSAEQAWERIAYFVERVVPAAEACGVRLGCHQHDPAMPPGVGYRGIERVLGSLDGVRRFLALSSSPSHGLNLCQGTIAEMCAAPEQVYDAIAEFAPRAFWVHFRNIRGGYLAFDEVFPDEGSIDMVRALRLYQQAGYDGVLVPDHVPQAELDTAEGHRAQAFCYGYIRGLLQSLVASQA